MDDEAVARLADLVADRVFTSMSKFVDALEAVVRENENLRTKVAHLELLVFGPDDDGDQDDDTDGYELVPIDEIDDFFEGCWDEPEEDDGEPPTFD